MKLRILAVLFLAAVVSSCSSGRYGCYQGRSISNGEFGVSSTCEIKGDIQPKLSSIELKQLSVPAIVLADPVENTGTLIAMNAGAAEEPVPYGGGIYPQMEESFSIAAGAVERKWISRMLNKAAVRMASAERAAQNRSPLAKKIREKIIEKIFPAPPATMDVADILAIVSMVAGIVATGAFYGSFMLGVGAIVLGAIALHRGTAKRPMAIVGIVLGAVAITVWSAVFGAGWI